MPEKVSEQLPVSTEPVTTSRAPVVLHPIRRLRVEANFLKFPFFDLTRESSKTTRDILEVRDSVPAPNGERIEILWQVERSVNSKFPGEFARRIHREVVERVLSNLPRPVQNPLRLGSFSDICRMLEIRPSGRSLQEIRSALQSVFKTSVLSKSTFYSKARKSYIEDNFHLYDRVIFAGDTLPDGSVSNAVFIVLGSWYLESLNTSYVVPLDFAYFRQLRGSISSRMYELLHHWFFVALRNNQTVIERRYSVISAYFPLARQDTLWKARKQLREAHKQHQDNGYLACPPEWRPLSGNRTDWVLVYTAGPRARDEFRRNQSRRDQDAITPDELLVSPARPPLAIAGNDEKGLSEVQQALAKELEIRGITGRIALALVHENESALIHGQMESFDWLVGKKDRRVSQNPAGYLRRSIEEHYATPSGFIPREERQRQVAAKVARELAENEAKARAAREQGERTARIDAIWDALPNTDREEITKLARACMPDFAIKMLQNEEQEGRRSIGHEVLQSEIRKLVESRETAKKGES